MNQLLIHFFSPYLNEPKDEHCFASKADVQLHDEDRIKALTKEYLEEPEYFIATFCIVPPQKKRFMCRMKSCSLTVHSKNHIDHFNYLTFPFFFFSCDSIWSIESGIFINNKHIFISKKNS